MTKNIQFKALQMVERILGAVRRFDDKLTDSAILGLTICGEISKLAKEKADDQLIYVRLEEHIKNQTHGVLTEEERLELVETCAEAAIEFRRYRS